MALLANGWSRGTIPAPGDNWFSGGAGCATAQIDFSGSKPGGARIGPPKSPPASSPGWTRYEWCWPLLEPDPGSVAHERPAELRRFQGPGVARRDLPRAIAPRVRS